ncbi:MAG: hypothetical protein ACRD8A_03065 [Candidatus Acidiferrales bacterium]
MAISLAIFMMRLKKIILLKERVAQPHEYPFNIPTIASLSSIEVTIVVASVFSWAKTGLGNPRYLRR